MILFSKKSDKKAQMQISFGMIFSIILIIAFIAFAIFAIQKFLAFQRDVQINHLVDKIEYDVNLSWKSQRSQEIKNYSLPSNIIEICFLDDEFGNMILQTKTIYHRKNIPNLDISKMIQPTTNGRLCFESVKGKVSMKIKKEFGEDLVSIEKV